MNTKKLKNRGFSLFVSIVASLILMGVSVAIIASINRSLDQANNIARSNQAFFMAEAGKEAALFHHSVRGAGLKLDDSQSAQNINFPELGADVQWKIDGRKDEKIVGTMHENEKITIPLYWDSSDNVGAKFSDSSIQGIDAAGRQSLKLSFPDNPIFKDQGDNKVAIVFSVSRKNSSGKYETWIPQADNPSEPCSNSSFYCKKDMEANGGTAQNVNWANGIINFNDTTNPGKILPSGDTTTSLKNFMADSNSANYEISFQPVLPFIDNTDKHFAVLNFKLEGNNNVKIPRNIYTITSTVNFKGFKKVVAEDYKEKPSIGAFDYTIFK